MCRCSKSLFLNDLVKATGPVPFAALDAVPAPSALSARHDALATAGFDCIDKARGLTSSETVDLEDEPK